MSLRNFHVDGNVTDEDLMLRLSNFAANINGSFRQLVANGGFTFGPVKLQNPDLNRIHAIVGEIDSRRVFYECGQDEVPRYAMQSLYSSRDEIRVLSRGVWADPSCERIVHRILDEIANVCTAGEKLGFNDDSAYSLNNPETWNVMTDMRLKVWYLVGLLKEKTGRVIQPRHLPQEIGQKAQDQSELAD